MVMYPSLTEIKNLQGIFDFIYAENQKPLNRFSTLINKEFEHVVSLAGGFWRHNGDPKAPHAVLRSGKHSDGFVALPEALKHVAINKMFAEALAKKIEPYIYHYDLLRWLVGSDHAAGTFSYATANDLRKNWRFRGIKHDFTEKTVVDGEEIQKWSRHVIGKNEFVLQIEELCTTNLTLKRVRDGITKAHPDYPINYVPIIGMAVNRTGSDNFEGRKIISLLYSYP